MLSDAALTWHRTLAACRASATYLTRELYNLQQLEHQDSDSMQQQLVYKDALATLKKNLHEVEQDAEGGMDKASSVLEQQRLAAAEASQTYIRTGRQPIFTSQSL